MLLNHYCKNISSQEWKEHVNIGNTQESHIRWFPNISISESLRQWFENLENLVLLGGTCSTVNTARNAEIRFQTAKQKPTNNSARLLCLVVAWPGQKRTALGGISSYHFDRRDTHTLTLSNFLQKVQTKLQSSQVQTSLSLFLQKLNNLESRVSRGRDKWLTLALLNAVKGIPPYSP